MQAEPKKPYHHGDLRSSLLAAAEQALDDLPVDEVSLREIARRAGVSHAAPKHHFNSLGQLFAEVVAIGYERFHAALDEAANRNADQSPAQRLMAMGRAYVRFAKAHPAIYGLMFGKRGNVVETTPHLMSAMYAAWEQLQNQVAEVVGPARSVNAAFTVWATVHGLAMLRLENKIPPQIDPEAAAEVSVRTIILGLTADGN